MFSLTEIARIPEIVAIDEKFFPIVFHFDKDAACLMSTEKLLSPLEWGSSFIAIKDAICDIKSNWFNDGFESNEYLLPEQKTFFIKIIVRPLTTDVAEVLFQPLTKSRNVFNNLGNHYYQIVFRRNDTLLERIMAINEALYSCNLNEDLIRLLQNTHGVPSFVPDKRAVDEKRKDQLPRNYEVASCPTASREIMDRLLNENSNIVDVDDQQSESLMDDSVSVGKRILRKRKQSEPIAKDDDDNENDEDNDNEDFNGDDDENDVYHDDEEESDDSGDLMEFFPLTWRTNPVSKRRQQRFHEMSKTVDDRTVVKRGWPSTSAGIVPVNDGKKKRSDATVLPGKEILQQQNEAAKRKVSTGKESSIRMAIKDLEGTSAGFKDHIQQRTNDVILVFKQSIPKYIQWYNEHDSIEEPMEKSIIPLDIDRTKLLESMIIQMSHALYGEDVIDMNMSDVTHFVRDHVEKHFINSLQ